MVTLRKIANKPKYYFAFPIVVAAMVGANFIPVTCPVCSGSGVLSYSAGMEHVRVISVSSRIYSTTQDACTSYIVIKASPVFRISNPTEEHAAGYLVLRLINLANNDEIGVQNLRIEAPANALSTIESTVIFAYISYNIPPESMEIRAEVLRDDNVPCIACDGKSKVGLNTYPLAQAHRDTFVSIVRNSSDYGPVEDYVIVGGMRVVIGSKEWLAWMELD